MFLWFVKPKRRKSYKMTADYIDACSVHSPFFVAKTVSVIAWFICIPFLLISFSETVSAFLVVTIISVALDLITKLLDPNYYYF